MASVALILLNRWLILLVVPLVLIAAFKAAVFYVTTRLNYDMRWYMITDRSLLIREGVWIVREITLTFANAQNVRVTKARCNVFSGFPMSRWTLLAAVSDTKNPKATSPHRAVLRGLASSVQVRDLVLEQLRKHRTTGLGDPDDHAAGAPPL